MTRAPVPLIELHCHLDASLRISTIEQLVSDSGLTYDRPVHELAMVPEGSASLPELLTALDIQIDVLQSIEAVERAAFELGEDFATDGVIHGEVRFAPHLLQRNGESIDSIIAAAARGLARAEHAHDLSTSLILCALRHRDPQEGVELVEAAERLPGTVDALDLAGPEAGFPASPFRPAFEAAQAAGLGITIHAGEAAGPASIREAIDLGATRIGHGVRAIADTDLVATLARESITLECAPTCNVATLAVPSLAEHPIDELADLGVPTTVNTDTRTCLPTTLRNELAVLESSHEWNRARVARAQRAAARAAFVSERRRSELLAAIDEGA